MTPPAITLEKEGADKTSLVRMLNSALERKLTGRMLILNKIEDIAQVHTYKVTS